MATYQATTYEMHHPAAGQHEAAQGFDALTADLNLYTTVENTDMHRPPGEDTWKVHVYNANGDEGLVDAPTGLLIRQADERTSHVSYTYIDTEGNRRLLNTDQGVYPVGVEGVYPVEVAGRLLTVRDRLQELNAPFENPLGLAFPEALRSELNENSDARTRRNVGEELRNWAKQTRLGKLAMRLFSGRSNEPHASTARTEVAEPQADPAEQPFAPTMVPGEPLPRRHAPAAPKAQATATARTETAPAAGRGLTDLAAKLGLVANEPQPAATAPTAAEAPGATPNHVPGLSPAERAQLNLDYALFDVGRTLGMTGNNRPSIDSLRVRGDAAAAVQTTIAEYRRRMANGDASAAPKLAALIQLMPAIKRS